MVYSLIIPTFNYAHLLPRAIDSALAQGDENLDIVVVDDCSTDGTPQVLAGYGPRIRVVRRDRNCGPFACVMAGLAVARGEWGTIYDADDALRPGAVAALRAAIAANPAARVVVGPWESVDVDGRIHAEPFLPPSGDRDRDVRDLFRGRLRFIMGAAAIHRTVVAPFTTLKSAPARGMETVAFAHWLMHHRFASVTRPLIAVHDHPGRLRHNPTTHSIGSDDIVAALFDSGLAPPDAMHLRAVARGMIQRDGIRLDYRAGRHTLATRRFVLALRADPWGTLKDLRNLRRAATSLVMRPFTRDPGYGPRAIPVVLSGRGQAVQFKTDPMGFLRRAHFAGDVVRLGFRRRTYLVSHPEDVRHVLVSAHERYHRTGFLRDWGNMLGRGIFTADGREHFEQRRMLAPFFRPSVVGSTVPVGVEAVLRAAAPWRAGAVNIAPSMLEAALEFSLRTVLGGDDPACAREMYRNMIASHTRGVQISNCPAHRLWAQAPSWRRSSERTLAPVRHAMVALMRRAEAPDAPFSMVSMLLEALRRGDGGPALTEHSILDNAMVMFIATAEPLASTMSCAVWRLAQHPDHAAVVAAEVRSVLQGAAPTGRDDQSLPLTRAFLLETLRLHPSNWVMPRRAAAADVLPGGLRVHRGEEVWVCQHAMHYDGRVFPDPQRFDPGRYLGDDPHRPGDGVYLPFGAGARNCIGGPVVLIVGMAMLVALVQRWRFSLLPGESLVQITTNRSIAQVAGPRAVVNIEPVDQSGERATGTAAGAPAGRPGVVTLGGGGVAVSGSGTPAISR